MWKKRAQVQMVLIMGKKKEDSGRKGGTLLQGKSAPAAREEAGAPRNRKCTGKKVEKDGRRKHGIPYTGKGTARSLEEEFDGGAKKASGGTLWQRSARGSTVARIGVVHPRNSSNVQSLQM